MQCNNFIHILVQELERKFAKKNPPLGSESVIALSSCRMWTVCMINCLRYASYHADTGPLEPMMCRSQVRVPWEKWVNSTTDCNLKTTGSKQIFFITFFIAFFSSCSQNNTIFKKI
jgi:hypothetical protein